MSGAFPSVPLPAYVVGADAPGASFWRAASSGRLPGPATSAVPAGSLERFRPGPSLNAHHNSPLITVQDSRPGEAEASCLTQSGLPRSRELVWILPLIRMVKIVDSFVNYLDRASLNFRRASNQHAHPAPPRSFHFSIVGPSGRSEGVVNEQVARPHRRWYIPFGRAPGVRASTVVRAGRYDSRRFGGSFRWKKS